MINIIFIISQIVFGIIAYGSTIGKIICNQNNLICNSALPTLNRKYLNRPIFLITQSEIESLFANVSPKFKSVKFDYNFPRILNLKITEETPLLKILTQDKQTFVTVSDTKVLDQNIDNSNLIEAVTDQPIPPVGSFISKTSLEPLVNLIQLNTIYNLKINHLELKNNLITANLSTGKAKFFILKDLNLQAARLQHILSHTTIDDEVLVDLQYEQPIMTKE